MESNIQTPDDWEYMLNQLKDRAGTAIKKPSFILSFIFVLIFFGGAGIWVPYVFDHKNNLVLFKAEALFTYSVAIVASILTDFILSDRIDLRLKSVSMLAFSISSIALCMLIYGYIYPNIDNSSCWALLGSILILSIWFLAYANDPKFDQRSNFAPIVKENPEVSDLKGGF